MQAFSLRWFLLVFVCFYFLSNSGQAIIEKEKHPRQRLYEALSSNNMEQAESLLEKELLREGTLIDRYGEIEACHFATLVSEKGTIQMMGMLLKTGVDIECSVQAVSGDTPLMVAYMAEKREMVKFLVEQGADINFTNNFGATTFWASAANGDLDYVTFFLKYAPIIDQPGRFPDPLKERNNIVANLTPLMMASARGHTETVKILIENGAFINMTDSYGRNARYYAEKSGHGDIVKLLDDWE